MAITPAQGYIVDPNNPNGVIKDPNAGASTSVNPNANYFSQNNSAQGVVSPYYNPNASSQNPIAPTQTSDTTQPTIPVGTGAVKPSLPMAQTPVGVGAAQSAISNVGALNGNNGQNITPSQNALLNTTDTNLQSATDTYNQDKTTTQNLMNQYLGMGADQTAQEQAAGVPGLMTNANSLTQQYNAAQATYNSQYNSIQNDPTMTIAQRSQAIDSLQQQHGYNLTNIGIQQSIAQNDYNNAENLIQHQITIKYGALANTISYQQQFLAQDQTILSANESQSFQANLAVQQQMYTQQTYYAQLNASTGMSMIQTAAANKAPQSTIDSMSSLIASGASAGEIASAGGQYLSDGSYSYQFNPSTQQFSLINSKTGLSADGTSPTTSSITQPIVNLSDPSSSSIVNTPSGQQFDLSGYATDPQNGLKVQTATSTIVSQVGQINSPQSAQAAISTFAPTSTLTGTQLYNAATSNGIDPTFFAAQIKQESLFGTSNIATADNNFGGITYTGSASQKAAGATQGTARPTSEGGFYAHFPNVAAGLDYQAQLLNQYKVAPPANTPGQTPTIQQSIQNVQTIKNELPSNISSGVSYINSTGDGYIDLSKVTDLPGYPAGSAQTQAESYAKTYGLAVLNSTQVGAVQDYDTAMQNINLIQNEWNTVAPQSLLGSVADATLNPISQFFQTSSGVSQIKYKSNIASAISTLNAITGSKRLSSFSASVSENSLPVLPGDVGGLFSSQKGDTLASGNAKIDNLKANLNSSLTAIIPQSKGAPLSTSLPSTPVPKVGDVVQVNGVSVMVNADGSLTVQ